MIEAVIGLLMFVNGEIKEARLQPSMAICLRKNSILTLFSAIDSMCEFNLSVVL